MVGLLRRDQPVRSGGRACSYGRDCRSCGVKAGERRIPFTDFHRLPGSTPERDNVLDRGDLIVAIEVPASAEARASHYLKVRDRASYEFALVSAAAAVAMDGGRIRLGAARDGRRCA